MCKIGYARVSTGEQNLDLQRDALRLAGCKDIFTDQISGSKAERPGLDKLLAFVREGDTIVVWRLDRLGRSLTHLISQIRDFNDRGIGFTSLQENIDTTSSVGKLVFHIFGALAEFERDLIKERTMAGLRSARARGRVGGRKPVMTEDKIKIAMSLMKDKSNTVTQICKTLNISRPTLYNHLTPAGERRNK